MTRLTLFAIPAILAVAACDSVVYETGPDATPPSPGLSLALSGLGEGTVVSSPGGIDCGADCDEPFADGTVVNLLATADPGSTFIGWGGSCSGASTTCTVTVDGPISVTATYDHEPVALVVTSTGTGTGTVTSSPTGISCGTTCDAMFEFGATVTLTATPTDGTITFRGWSGACTGIGACTVTMDGPKNVVADYRRECQAAPFTVTASGSTLITVPANCGAAAVKMWGGGGGGGSSNTNGRGGGAGFAAAKIVTVPGEGLMGFVGAGGSPANVMYAAGGGGGSSAVVRGAVPLIVAGGGGGGGSSYVGGGGGGLDGGNGGGFNAQSMGKGGSQSTGGAGGTSLGGGTGVSGTGFNGGAGGSNQPGVVGGSGAGGAGHGTGGAGGSFVGGGGGAGGGGGGFFGGGGGGGSNSGCCAGGGGGGGSSYVSFQTNVDGMTAVGGDMVAANNTDPAYVAGTGVGGAQTASGGAGRIVITWTTE